MSKTHLKTKSGLRRPRHGLGPNKGNTMAIQYLLVTYPDQRAVLAGGDGVGFTNHTLMLPADEYVITLDGNGYQPDSRDIVLAGTSMVRPLVIAFTPTAPGANVGAQTEAVTRSPAAAKRNA
jgi:hypothetical protein